MKQKLLLATVTILWCGNIRAQITSDFLSGRLKAYGVVAPFYNEMEENPSMIVRADAIFTDYERKAFFRVGVFPIAVMEGVTVEIHRSESLTNSLASMRRWVGSQAVTRFEFREVSFLASEGGTNRLESGRARFTSDGKLDLFDGVRFLSGTNQATAPRATLQVAGKDTGRIIMTTDPPTTNNLFEFSEPPSLRHKEAHEN